MHQKTALVECRQSVNSSLQHPDLLHIVVQIEVFLDFTATLCQHFGKLRGLTCDNSDNSLHNEETAITAVFGHADTFLSDSSGLCQEHFWVFALHCVHRLGFLVRTRVYFEKVSHNCEVHEPCDPQLEEDSNDDVESEKGASSQCNNVDPEEAITAMHSNLQVV